MVSTKYTLKEIAQHNGVEQPTVWIVINNKVYDVTKYIDEHPGGKDSIMEYAGQDATRDFKSSGHSSYASKVLKSYLIGDVDEEDKVINGTSAIIIEDDAIIPPKRSVFCCL